MNIYEYQAKELFKKNDIPIPHGRVASNKEEIERIISSMNGPLVIKAQVLSGGRGKAGGIRFGENIKAKNEAENLLGSTLKGFTIKRVLIEEKLNIEAEYYIGITIDRARGCPVLIVSSLGGVGIEEISKLKPDKIAKELIDLRRGINIYQIKYLLKKVGINPSLFDEISKCICKIYEIFRKYDAELVEINPLAVTPSGVVAADARISVDDNALFRQPTVKKYKELSTQEAKADLAGVRYIELDGNIGIMSTGAGVTMATMDLVFYMGGKPACFMDCAGNMAREGAKIGIELLLNNQKVNVILISTYTGGRAEKMAEKIVDAIEGNRALNIPVVVRIQGRNEEKANRLLQSCNYPLLHIAETIEDAVEKAVKLGV